MSKSQPVTQNATQTTTIPGWLTSAASNVANQAGNLPQWGGLYTGAGPAGLTPDQLQAIGLASSNVGMGQGVANMAINPLIGLSGYNAPNVNAGSLAGQINGLLNPATQDVLNATNRQIDFNTAQAMAGADANLGAQHAFGGDRQALADAAVQSQGLLQKNQLAAQLNQGNYNTALSTALAALQGNQGAANQAAGIRLGAGQGLGGLGTTLAGINTQDLSNLLGAGGTAQNTQSLQNQFNYQNWLSQYQIPEQILQGQAGALGSLPHDTTQTGQQTQMSYSNPLLGLAGLGLGIGSWAMPGGGSLGGGLLSSMFGRTS